MDNNEIFAWIFFTSFLLAPPVLLFYLLYRAHTGDVNENTYEHWKETARMEQQSRVTWFFFWWS